MKLNRNHKTKVDSNKTKAVVLIVMEVIDQMQTHTVIER